MREKVSDYQVAETGFELFVKARDWYFMGFKANIKNPSQFIGTCLDSKGDLKQFLISQKGNYYQYFGPKDWRPVEYVLKERGME